MSQISTQIFKQRTFDLINDIYDKYMWIFLLH